MTHTLYRKYRPQTFADLVCQDHIVSVLENSIKNNTITHAYLFTGPRGTGKTSTARIFAREIKTSPEDIIELDAASNRGIDDIRSLRDSVRMMPFSSPKKVYIIDEVHMLSKDAFNALLKTLEEPPSHVVFILATTELHKVPDTIRSRCQVFTFHAPKESELIEYLNKIAKAEKVTIDPETIIRVATIAHGSFRDALTNLQKVSDNSKGESMTNDKANEILGRSIDQEVHLIFEALKNNSLADALKVSQDIREADMAVEEFFDRILDLYRKCIFIRYADEKMLKEDFFADKDEKVLLKKVVEDNSKIITTKNLDKLLSYRTQVFHSPIKVIPLEMALIEILTE